MSKRFTGAWCIFWPSCLCLCGIQVTLLCQVGSDLACQNTSSATISIVKVRCWLLGIFFLPRMLWSQHVNNYNIIFLWQSLIGHFDLDPNRVFDIVSSHFFIPVLLSDIVKVCHCYNLIMFFLICLLGVGMFWTLSRQQYLLSAYTSFSKGILLVNL